MMKEQSLLFYLAVFFLAVIVFFLMSQRKELTRFSQKISELELQIKSLQSVSSNSLQKTDSTENASSTFDPKQVCLLFNGYLKNEKTSPFCELEVINQVQSELRALHEKVVGTPTINSYTNNTTSNTTSAVVKHKPPPNSAGGGAEVIEPDKKTVCSALWGTAKCIEGKVVCPTGTEKVFLRTGESRRKYPKSHFFCK